MEKMREEFNEVVATGAIMQDFFCVTSGYASRIRWLDGNWDGIKYGSVTLQYAWSIWKASRAVLCVNISDLEFSQDKNGDGGIILTEVIKSELDNSGVRYE